MPTHFAHAYASMALVLVAGVPVVAQAQSAAENALGRSEFQAGVDAARRDAWPEALTHFDRAHTLLPDQPLVMLNLASAQARTGHLVDAAAAYRVFLRTAPEGDARAGAEAALSRVEHRVPHIALHAHGLLADDALLLDDTVVSRAVLGAPLPADPGDHAVAVRRDGHIVATVAVHVDEGDVRDADLTVPALAARVLRPVRPAVSPRARTVSPWVWIPIGLGVAVVGGAIATTVVLTSHPPGTSLPDVPIP